MQSITQPLVASNSSSVYQNEARAGIFWASLWPRLSAQHFKCVALLDPPVFCPQQNSCQSWPMEWHWEMLGSLVVWVVATLTSQGNWGHSWEREWAVTNMGPCKTSVPKCLPLPLTATCPFSLCSKSKLHKVLTRAMQNLLWSFPVFFCPSFRTKSQINFSS